MRTLMLGLSAAAILLISTACHKKPAVHADKRARGFVSPTSSAGPEQQARLTSGGTTDLKAPGVTDHSTGVTDHGVTDHSAPGVTDHSTEDAAGH